MMQFSKQQGLTLVELMVAGLLSVAAIFFVTNIMLSSSQTAMQSEGLAQAQENGRFILSWLQNNIRKAGYPYPKEGIQSRIQPFANRCASATPAPPADNADCTLESNTGSDRIAVNRTFVSDASKGSPADQLDCTGAAITGIADGQIITDVYWVENNFSGATVAPGYNDVLRCVTYHNHVALNSTQTIASGILSMHALYGSSNVTNDQQRTSVTRYSSLADLGTINWETVRAIQIAVLTRAFSTTGLDEKKRGYIVLDANPLTYQDRVARHIQTTTIYLPNE